LIKGRGLEKEEGKKEAHRVFLEGFLCPWKKKKASYLRNNYGVLKEILTANSQANYPGGHLAFRAKKSC